MINDQCRFVTICLRPNAPLGRRKERRATVKRSTTPANILTHPFPNRFSASFASQYFGCSSNAVTAV